MNLEFEDIVVKTKKSWTNRQRKTILHGVSGRFRYGELSAVMGPSGAGKSTLLNVLSGFRTRKSDGVIKINGSIVDRHYYKKASRYITQDNLLPYGLTTLEAMEFAANLKMSRSVSEKHKIENIKDILDTLGLIDCFYTKIDKLSGGQKKRLAIALEIINNPLIFFLDEPATGLDNVATTLCLEILKKLSRQGRTIICTIHQPSASLFAMFDHVYVLGRGQCVYQGSTQQLVPFLSTVGIMCPISYNPADYIIEIVDADEDNVTVLSKATKNGKTEERLQIKETEKGSVHSLQTTESDTDKLDVDDMSFEYPINIFYQFYYILNRMMLQLWRNKLALYIQIVHHLFCGLAFGLVFYNKANDGFLWMLHLKFCVCIAMFHTYTNIMGPVLTFPFEVLNIRKEHFNGWYSLHAYYAALMIYKIPLQIVLGFVFSIIVQYMFGLPMEFIRVFYFFLTGVFLILVSDALGMAVGCSFSVLNGAIVGPVIMSLFLGLGIYGFDFADDIPWVFNVLMQTSLIRKGIVASAIVVFGYNRPDFDCFDMYCHFKSPKRVLQFAALDNVSVWQEYVTLFILFVVFKLIGYFALKNRVN